MADLDFIVGNGLIVTNNVKVKGQVLSIGSSVTYVSSGINLTTSEIVIDSSDTTLMRASTYLMQVATETEFQISEILLVHNGSVSTITEYAVLTTGELPLATFRTDIVDGNVRLLGSMNSGSGTIFFQKTSIETVPLEI